MALIVLCLFVLMSSLCCDEYHEDFPPVSTNLRQKRSSKIHHQQSPSYWVDEGRRELTEALLLEPNKRMAKNIVLVIGDGMSLSTNTAGRIFKGQSLGEDGVSSHLSWDKFPHIGKNPPLPAVMTGNTQDYPRLTTWTPWCRTAQPPPSACTAG